MLALNNMQASYPNKSLEEVKQVIKEVSISTVPRKFLGLWTCKWYTMIAMPCANTLTLKWYSSTSVSHSCKRTGPPTANLFEFSGQSLWIALREKLWGFENVIQIVRFISPFLHVNNFHMEFLPLVYCIFVCSCWPHSRRAHRVCSIASGEPVTWSVSGFTKCSFDYLISSCPIMAKVFGAPFQEPLGKKK